MEEITIYQALLLYNSGFYLELNDGEVSGIKSHKGAKDGCKKNV